VSKTCIQLNKVLFENGQIEVDLSEANSFVYIFNCNDGKQISVKSIFLELDIETVLKKKKKSREWLKALLQVCSLTVNWFATVTLGQDLSDPTGQIKSEIFCSILQSNWQLLDRTEENVDETFLYNGREESSYWTDETTNGKKSPECSQHQVLPENW